MTNAADTSEINGDAPMPAATRIRYVIRNLLRNVRFSTKAITVKKWVPPRIVAQGIGVQTASPARFLAEAFIVHKLPRLIAPRRLRVLDVGCGSGRMAGLLGQAGFSGHYIGVDVSDRFAGEQWQGGPFTTEFIECDAHKLALSPGFDLVISNSVLEHIPEDVQLVARLQILLARNGQQVHIVPSTWALFLYLWHGYRQYGRAAIAACFPGTPPDVYRIGGGASFVVHLMLITIPEVLCRRSIRKRLPGLYAAVLRVAIKADRLVPFLPSGYAVISRAEDGSRG